MLKTFFFFQRLLVSEQVLDVVSLDRFTQAGCSLSIKAFITCQNDCQVGREQAEQVWKEIATLLDSLTQPSTLHMYQSFIPQNYWVTGMTEVQHT